MSSLLGKYYKWRLKTPQERIVKFQEAVNNMLIKYGAKIVANVQLSNTENEKIIKERLEKLKDDYGVDIQANVELIARDWGEKNDEPEKLAEK